VIANELRARQRRDRLHQHALHDLASDRAITGDHAAVIAEQVRVRLVPQSLSPMAQEVLRLTEWNGWAIRGRCRAGLLAHRRQGPAPAAPRPPPGGGRLQP
jgi:hypothetical protein